MAPDRSSIYSSSHLKLHSSNDHRVTQVQNTAKFLKKKETRLAHGQEVVGARLASVKAVALATAAAWDALVSDDAAVHSEVEPLMQRAVQLQKAWHAEDDKRRQREQAARDLIEAQRSP